MQMFGLISLIIVLALGAWLAISSMNQVVDEEGNATTAVDYNEALDAARAVTGN